jgi:hypothetical protein
VSSGSALVHGGILPVAEICLILTTIGSYNLTLQIFKSGRGGVDLAINDYSVSDKTPHHNLQPNNDVEIKEAGFWKIAVG